MTAQGRQLNRDYAGRAQRPTIHPAMAPKTIPVTRIGAYAFVIIASGTLVRMPTTTPDATAGSGSRTVAAKKLGHGVDLIVHQNRTAAVRDRRKYGLTFEAVVRIRAPGAFDEPELAKDMLRDGVRCFGDRDPVPVPSGVRKTLRDEPLRDPSAAKGSGHTQQEEMEPLAGTHLASVSILRVELAEDVEDRLELRAQGFSPHRHRRRRILREQRAHHFTGARGTGHDGEPVGGGSRTEETNQAIELRRSEPDGDGRRIAFGEDLSQERQAVIEPDR